MIQILVKSNLRGLKKLPRNLEKSYSEGTKHISEICARAAIRNLRQVTDTGALVNSISVEKAGNWNHKVIVGKEYGTKFEKGVPMIVPDDGELLDWAIRRSKQGYRSKNLPLSVASKGYVYARYDKSPARQFMSRAVLYTKRFAKSTAEYHIQKALR